MKQYTPEKFKELPKAKQRVIIAEDVQFRISIRLTDARSSYRTIYIPFNKENLPARERLLKNEIHCEGCAKAAMFISSVIFLNELTLGQVESPNIHGYGQGGQKFTEKVFPASMQNLIETAFEEHAIKETSTRIERNAAIAYGCSLSLEFDTLSKKDKGYYKDNQRNYVLYWLMDNIVKHKGEFIIPKKFYES